MKANVATAYREMYLKRESFYLFIFFLPDLFVSANLGSGQLALASSPTAAAASG